MAIHFFCGRNVNIDPSGNLVDPTTLVGTFRDYSSHLEYDSVRTQTSQELKGDIFSGRIWRYPGLWHLVNGDYTAPASANHVVGLPFKQPPRAGDEIVLWDSDTTAITPEDRANLGVLEARLSRDSSKEYAGIIVSTHFYRQGTNYEVWEFTAVDYTVLLDRVYITANFPLLEQEEGNRTASINAGEQIVKVLEQTQIHMDNLAGTVNDPENTDEYYQYMLREDNLDRISRQDGIVPRIPLLRIRSQLPSQIFDNIGTSSGYFWHIDYDMKVNFYDATNTVAPIDQIIMSSDDEAEVNLEIFDWEEEESIEGIATYMRMANILSSSNESFEDRFDITASLLLGGITIIELQHTINTEAAISYIRSFRSDGVRISAFVTITGDSPQIRLRPYVPRPNEMTTDAVFVKRGSAAQGASERTRLFFHPDSLQDGGYITIRYFFARHVDFPIEGDNLAIDRMKVRLGGTGIHEFIYSRLAGLYVEDTSRVLAIGKEFLNRKQNPIIRGSFSTFRKGWRPGQQFTRKDQLSDDSRGSQSPHARGRYQDTPLYVINTTKTIDSPVMSGDLSGIEQHPTWIVIDNNGDEQERKSAPLDTDTIVGLADFGQAKVQTNIEYSNVPRGINA